MSTVLTYYIIHPIHNHNYAQIIITSSQYITVTIAIDTFV